MKTRSRFRKNLNVSGVFLCGFLCLLVAGLIGCHRGPIVPTDLNPAPIEGAAELPDYAELVGRYNTNAAALERVFARTKVELRWRDDKGRPRRESGDGRLIFERPLNTAWTVEKFGDVKLWAGSDERGFWLFDEYDEHVAYYGMYGRPMARPLPLPVQPEAVPYLLGLVPIDPTRRPAPPEVELFNGYHVIEPPGLNLRLMLHPDTARPVRIDLTDRWGNSALTCLLSGETPVADSGHPPVVLPAKAELYPRGEESRMTVELSSATTDDARIRRRYFAFEELVRAMKPREVVDLNAF